MVFARSLIFNQLAKIQTIRAEISYYRSRASRPTTDLPQRGIGLRLPNGILYLYRVKLIEGQNRAALRRDCNKVEGFAVNPVSILKQIRNALAQACYILPDGISPGYSLHF